MGAADAAIKAFMSNPKNFADAFNQGLFGQKVIDASKLRQINPEVSATLFPDGGNRFLREVHRTLDDAMIAETIKGGAVNMCKAMREITDEINGYKATIAEIGAQLTKKDGQLAEKDDQLAEKDGQLAEKDSMIEQLRQQIAQLKAMTNTV